MCFPSDPPDFLLFLLKFLCDPDPPAKNDTSVIPDKNQGLLLVLLLTSSQYLPIHSTNLSINSLLYSLTLCLWPVL